MPTWSQNRRRAKTLTLGEEYPYSKFPRRLGTSTRPNNPEQFFLENMRAVRVLSRLVTDRIAIRTSEAHVYCYLGDGQRCIYIAKQ